MALSFFGGECKVGREEENRIIFFAKAALDKRTHVQNVRMCLTTLFGHKSDLPVW